MEFEFRHFNELTLEELYKILRLRSEIFVVEQNCVYNDLDGFDNNAIHLFLKEKADLIAYSRILKPGTRFPDYSIGRVIVKENYRRTGLGARMMEVAKSFLFEECKAEKIKISAQSYLQDFYENLGFRIVTEMYPEDGIPHFGMICEKNGKV